MNRESPLGKDKQRSPINLAKFNGEIQYVCDDCGIVLALFPSTTAAVQFPFERGPHYICPKCHIITDLSQNKPPGLDDVQPLNLQPPVFVMSPEDKGGTPESFGHTQVDPEPQEEAYLKSIGATLISKRIQV